MNHSTVGLWLLACGLVAGCSGSSSDGSSGSGSFDDLSSQADDLLNEVGTLDYTDPATLPTTGASTYTGVVGLNLASVPDTNLQGYDIIGDLSVTANFAGAGDPITGQASGFVGADDSSYDGTLIIDDGTIDRLVDPATGSTFTADMAGVLTAEDGTDMTIDSHLSGDFVGEDQSHIFGTVVGSSCTVVACTSLAGGIAGER